MQYKHSLISSLLFRVFNICSDYELVTEEIEKVKTIWLKNSYPLRLIDKLIYIFFNKMFITKTPVHTVSRKKLTISLEYIGSQSLQLKNR